LEDHGRYISISHGSLDEPEFVVPKAHQWTHSALPWFQIQDELPSFSRPTFPPRSALIAGQEISGHRVTEPAPVKAVETAAQETPKNTATSGWGEPGNYVALPRAAAAFSILSASSFESRFLGVALSRKSLAKSRHELVLAHLPSAALTHGA